MVITCTEEEKKKIIEAFYQADFCDGNDSIKCYSDDMNCRQCLEKNINWHIIKGK